MSYCSFHRFGRFTGFAGKIDFLFHACSDVHLMKTTIIMLCFEAHHSNISIPVRNSGQILFLAQHLPDLMFFQSRLVGLVPIIPTQVSQ